MVTTTEIALLLLVLVLLFGAYTVIKTIKPVIINAVIRLVILVVANVAGLGVAITQIAVLVCPTAVCRARSSSSSWRTSRLRSPG